MHGYCQIRAWFTILKKSMNCVIKLGISFLCQLISLFISYCEQYQAYHYPLRTACINWPVIF